MPQIIVIADTPAEDGDPPIMFRERVSVSDFESQHFATQLVERLGWAVGDADSRSQGGSPVSSDRLNAKGSRVGVGWWPNRKCPNRNVGPPPFCKRKMRMT